MSYQTKSKLAAISAWALLGLIVVAIATVSVITFSTANRKVPPLSVTPSETSSNVKPEKTQSAATPVPPTAGQTKLPDKTVLPTAEPEETKKVPTGNDKVESFTKPAEGYVMKAHSLDLPVFSFTMADYRTHNGIDVSAPEGSKVCAAASGKISKIYNDPMMGKTVEIDHGGRTVSVYSNLGDELAPGIAVGVSVGEGQIIGCIGSSALAEVAESDHLHFELKVGGQNVDPLKYLGYSSLPVTDVPGNE